MAQQEPFCDEDLEICVALNKWFAQRDEHLAVVVSTRHNYGVYTDL